MFPLYRQRVVETAGKVNYNAVYRFAIKEKEGCNKVIPPKNERYLRVMTYNVNAFEYQDGRSVEMIINVLKDVQPDIVAFQEFNWNGAFVEAARELGYKWMCYQPAVKKPEFGNAILSKVKFSSECSYHRYMTEFREPRNWVKAEFYGKVVVFGTHLDVFDKTGRTRLGQINELLREVKKEVDSGKYVIVMGDLNSMRRGDYSANEIENIKYYSLNPLLSGGIHPLDFKVAERIDETGLLNNVSVDSKFSVKTGKRVDFIYLSKGLEKYLRNGKGYVYYSLGSDHLPIFCDLLL